MSWGRSQEHGPKQNTSQSNSWLLTPVSSSTPGYWRLPSSFPHLLPLLHDKLQVMLEVPDVAVQLLFKRHHTTFCVRSLARKCRLGELPQNFRKQPAVTLEDLDGVGSRLLIIKQICDKLVL